MLNFITPRLLKHLHNIKIPKSTLTGVCRCTIKHVHQTWKERFIANNIPEPTESIENILAHVLKLPNVPFVNDHFNDVLSENDALLLDKLCEERLKRKPIQYILGYWQFRRINVKLRRPVFIPRPETEQLVQLVINHLSTYERNEPVTILEPCCGSGAISLSILDEYKHCTIVAFDRNPDACALTKENQNALSLENLTIFNHTLSNDLSFQSDEKFDVIVSNPPYIPSDVVKTLPEHILWYEDHNALDGGLDGTDVTKLIIRLANSYLKPSGVLLLEIDPNQVKLLEEYVQTNCEELQFIGSHLDFNNVHRFVEIR